MDEINVDDFVYILERENNRLITAGCLSDHFIHQSPCNTIVVDINCFYSRMHEN